MKYRARITKIVSWIEDHYDTDVDRLVMDAKDVYIEVKSEDEADLLEAINKAQEKRLELESEWRESYFGLVTLNLWP